LPRTIRLRRASATEYAINNWIAASPAPFGNTAAPRRPRQQEPRAALAGFNSRALLGARLDVLTLTALAATAVSLAATAMVFDATHWPTYIAAKTRRVVVPPS
jgi:hypothetical protein